MVSGDRPRYLSTLEAAQALGVSVSTVKRWVDEGVLPAHRTAGGHRKLLQAEILALARRGEITQGDLAVLAAPAKLPAGLDIRRAAADLAKAMLNGRGAEVSAIIRRAYLSGVALEDLADRVISVALADVGHQWEKSRIETWREHRGTQLCAAALFEIKPFLDARAERNRPVAVGGAPEGDHYLLPSILAQYVLLDAGWDANNLGSNTPLTSFTAAIRELRPRLLWLSVSHIADQEQFVAGFHELYREAEQNGVAVAVGGHALTAPIRAAIPYTTHGDGLRHLAAFARTLHPRPRPPRRGRPPQR